MEFCIPADQGERQGVRSREPHQHLLRDIGKQESVSRQCGASQRQNHAQVLGPGGLHDALPGVAEQQESASRTRLLKRPALPLPELRPAASERIDRIQAAHQLYLRQRLRHSCYSGGRLFRRHVPRIQKVGRPLEQNQRPWRRL